MTKIKKPAPTSDMRRRGFFGAVAAGAAGSIAAATPARAEDPKPTKPSAAVPSAAATAAETTAPPREASLIARSGSDYMVDVLHGLKLDYVATMPGSTFRGLHESIINYGQNRQPELLTCVHEEIAVGMAHGYAKIAGKPIGALLHGVVGLQHGAMAIYNAWADRVPVVIIVGNTAAAEERRPGAEWSHSAQDNAAIVRDYVKWDDMPASLVHFGESMTRAYSIAMTPPAAPTLIVADSELQERAIPEEQEPVPRLSMPKPAVGDPSFVMEAAKMLVAAERPVIVVDRLVRSAAGMQMLIALAETLQAPVVDKGGRMNFPNRHPLNQSLAAGTLMHEADVIIGLEVRDLYATVHQYRDRMTRDSRETMAKGAKLISITAGDLLIHANFQDFQRYQSADLAISGDGEATLPILLDAVKRSMPASNAYADRGARLAAASAQSSKRQREAATFAWDASPISTARLVATLGREIEHEDWSLVSSSGFQSDWPIKLWNFDRPYRHIGSSGGYGVGYTGPSSIGAALANRDAGGRFSVSIMGDGELMCCPGTFWTAAHHRIPLLMVMHNNRAYHQELMHVQRIADRHGRGIERAHIGTTLDNPDIDFAKMADSMGVWSKGPISDPAALAPALREAIAVVKSGQPALVDVICQPR